MHTYTQKERERGRAKEYESPEKHYLWHVRSQTHSCSVWLLLSLPGSALVQPVPPPAPQTTAAAAATLAAGFNHHTLWSHNRWDFEGQGPWLAWVWLMSVLRSGSFIDPYLSEARVEALVIESRQQYFNSDLKRLPFLYLYDGI